MNLENNVESDLLTEDIPIFEIKKWNVVALWAWDVHIDTCAICKNQVQDPCIQCQSIQDTKQNDCQIAWGVCNHTFHNHCISKWITNRPVCPLCNRNWEYQKQN